MREYPGQPPHALLTKLARYADKLINIADKSVVRRVKHHSIGPRECPQGPQIVALRKDQ